MPGWQRWGAGQPPAVSHAGPACSQLAAGPLGQTGGQTDRRTESMCRQLLFSGGCRKVHQSMCVYHTTGLCYCSGCSGPRTLNHHLPHTHTHTRGQIWHFQVCVTLAAKDPLGSCPAVPHVSQHTFRADRAPSKADTHSGSSRRADRLAGLRGPLRWAAVGRRQRKRKREQRNRL